MQKRVATVVSLVLVASLTVYLAWNHLDYVDATKHDTTRWAVLQDVRGSVIAVEPTDDAVWQQLAALHQNGTRMWVGGVVERYGNKWGYRFHPDTIIVAQFTIEGAQATIRFISQDIDYWIDFGVAYVGAIVVEINPQPYPILRSCPSPPLGTPASQGHL